MNYEKSAYAGQVDVQRDIPELAQIIETIAAQGERAGRSAGQMEALIDRLHGASPQGASSGQLSAPRPVPNGVFAQFQDALARLDSELARITAASVRLDAIA